MYIYVQQCQGEIVLYPANEDQKPKTAVKGLHLLSFGIAQLFFMHIHIYYVICKLWTKGKVWIILQKCPDPSSRQEILIIITHVQCY